MATEIACKQGCGKTFSDDGAWRVKHELKCKGKPQTRGRIERLAARQTALVPVGHAKPVVRRKRARIASNDRTPPAANGLGAIQGAATDKAMEIVLAGLIARRERIDVAIAALQAVG